MREPMQWCDVFLNMAKQIAERSKDASTQCGAVLVNDANFILGVGFNGPPSQIDDSKVPWDIRHPNSPNKYDFVIHAEENALLAAYEAHGKRELANSTMYVTSHPCHSCVLRMIRAGVSTCIWPISSVMAKCVDDISKLKSKAIIAALKRDASFIGYEGGRVL